MLNTKQAITAPSLRVLRKPLQEFFDRVSAPVNLSLTLNRLIFDSLLRQTTFLPDELENLHALLDLLLVCQALSGATIVAEA
ncbi:hypothetical protein Q5H93_23275 [Hymenobacter sp. ASUV-10]|uniref:Uncharacterized protein n=1 Tax=Hymenobacter aranciens TaxID=3063996 RepID=A0ABT9BHD7_9BACT|nr:hypothetical protein [Hymenobacter sp. ASUV-10]MDO7877680.1 hypothetical protein [Hymenobacter sp. ASUV-10]